MLLSQCCLSFKAAALRNNCFLVDYEPNEYVSENGNFIDCTSGRIDPDPEKVCEFKLDYIRPCVYEDDYGWFEGVPCMILKLNRVGKHVIEMIVKLWLPYKAL